MDRAAAASSAATTSGGQTGGWWRARGTLYAFAVILPVAVLALRLAVAAWVGERPFLVGFFIPIILVAYFGGLGPGMVTVIVSAVGTHYFLVPAISTSVFGRPLEVVQWLIFVVGGMLVSVLSEALHRLRRRDAATIADFHEAQRALRENEELFTKAFRLSPDCLAIVRLSDHTVIRANEALCRLWGRHADEVIGKPTSAFTHPVNEEAQGAFLRTLQEQGEVHGHETTGRLSDGRLVSFVVSSRLITLGGDACVLSVMHDITDRKQAEAARRTSEERYRTLFEYAPDGIVIADAQSNYLDANASMCRMLGYTHDELIRLHAADIVVETEVAQVAPALATIKAGAGYHREWQFRRKNGTTFAAEVRATMMPDGNLLGMIRDISERQRTAETLAAERTLLRTLFDLLPDYIYVKDPESRFLACNDRCAGRFGVAATRDLIGKSDVDFFPAEFAAKFRAEELAVLRGIPVIDREERWTRADGGREIIQTTKVPLRDGAGKIVGIIGCGHDITKRKRDEETLAAERTLLRTLIDLLPDSIYVKDATSRFILLNEACARNSGVAAAADMLGKSDADFLAAGVAARSRNIELNVLRGGSLVNHEHPFVRPDGMRQVLLTTKVPLRDGAGNIVGIVGTSRDITESKRAEESIRRLNSELEQRVIERTAQWETANAELHRSRAIFINLFESLPGLYLVLTPDLKIVTASDAYTKATLTTRTSIVGRGLFEVFPDNPDDAAATGVSNLRASLERVRQTAAPDTMAIQKYDMRRPDGTFEEHFWSPINSPVLGADRRLEYIVHRVEEVTDFVRQKSLSVGTTIEIRARMEQMEAEVFQSSQKVQAANRGLEAANSELEAFSYSVSHDLRAPLRAIDGYSRAVLEDFGAQLPADGQRQLQTIRHSALKMGQLIDDLLRFSRLSRQPLSRHAVDTEKLVQSALADLAADQAGRQLQVKIGALPPSDGDPSLLKQVWVNLLSNALKYTRRRAAATVEVGWQRRDDADVFFVRDNGSGFDMQYAGKLFGVFQRLHRQEEFEGTGVGLAIVQRIVSRHGGRVWAEAAVDQGATFYFTLGEKTKS